MKNKFTILFSAVFICVFFVPAVSAQENSSNFSMGADMVSRYVWRGINLGGPSPAIQPFAEYSFGESGLSIGAWGSYSTGFGLYGAEADLYISFDATDWLNFTITDYFFPSDEAFEANDYFNYSSDETGHTIEAMVTVGGSDAVPFYATFAINIFGDDGVDENGDKYNAKYLEVGYNRAFQDFDASIFAGFALDDPKTDLGGAGWYGDDAGIINLGITISKDIKIVDKSLPVFSSLIFNPEAGNFYIVAGVSF